MTALIAKSRPILIRRSFANCDRNVNLTSDSLCRWRFCRRSRRTARNRRGSGATLRRPAAPNARTERALDLRGGRTDVPFGLSAAGHHVWMRVFRRLNRFRRTFIAVPAEAPSQQVLRATLSGDADLTIFMHDGGADLLWIDFDVEDTEKFSFDSVEAAQAFLRTASARPRRRGRSSAEVP